MTYLADAVVLFGLIVLNGFFAMAELALVSCSKPRLKVLIDAGHYGARTALKLTENPGKFLSTVQVGITLVGIFAGVYGGEELAPPLEQFFAGIDSLMPVAEELAIFVVVSSITYFSILIGELVPKQLALKHPERIASAIAPLMTFCAKLMTPIVYLLDSSAKALLWIFGATRYTDQIVTEEEVRAVIAEGVSAGVLEPAEKEMIGGVMRFADWRVGAIMTLRSEIEWMDLEENAETNRQQLRQSRYSRLPVASQNLDNVQGIIQVKDLLNEFLDGLPLDIRQALREPLYVSAQMSALEALELLKQSPIHLAIVLDEHGCVDGLLTLTDVLSALVGELAEPDGTQEPGAVRKEDGSWLIDGDLSIDILKDLLELRHIPGKKRFHTCAGFCLSQFEKMPTAGEYFDWEGFRFEVVDMDGNRIDKILVARR